MSTVINASGLANGFQETFANDLTAYNYAKIISF